MSLPVRLYPGQVSIYGAASITGLLVDNMQFGIVDQMWDDTDGTISLGQSVMFSPSRAISVTYGNVSYFLIEQNDIKLIETPLP